MFYLPNILVENVGADMNGEIDLHANLISYLYPNMFFSTFFTIDNALLWKNKM